MGAFEYQMKLAKSRKKAPGRRISMCQIMEVAETSQAAEVGAVRIGTWEEGGMAPRVKPLIYASLVT